MLKYQCIAARLLVTTVVGRQPGGVSGLLRRHSPRDLFVDFLFEVKAYLVAQFVFDLSALEQRFQTKLVKERMVRIDSSAH